MPDALAAEKTLRFPSGDVELDGRIFIPERGYHLRGCVVCHPHPLYGGDMNSSVVVAVTAALAARDIATLRFDFRGVGASGGRHGGGEAEVGDARAAVRALRVATGIDRIAIVGYSFGSVVALRMAAEEPEDPREDPGAGWVDAVAALAPPLAMFDSSFVGKIGGDLLFVAGDRDQYCPRDAFEALEGAGMEPGIVCASNSTERVLLRGADHFFAGFETRLGEIVGDWAKGLGTYP